MPDAWKFVNTDGTTRFILDDPQRVAAWRSAHEGEIVPLYAALNDAEREAIREALEADEQDAELFGDQAAEIAASALRGLLERHGGGK